ncbi:MAG: sugar phosphate isomerase/epimerase [Eubacteriales bacterium]|nr:sugar phosphate isomerase/epimerase [Eubacteriales bacterium]
MAIPISLELYSVRKALAADLEGTMKKVKSYGYEAVEFAGTPAFTAQRYAEALKETGLWCSGWHWSYQPFFGTDEEFEETVKFHKEVGNKNIIISSMPDDMLNSYEAVCKTAEKLNAASARLAAHGMRTGYHNHSSEFKVLPENGKTIWSTLREKTVSDFIMQIDTGNAMSGGADVNAEILASEGRAQIVHLKPYSSKTGYETIIGDLGDDMDYNTILPFCKEKGGTEVYVIEYECETLFSELEGVCICIENLRSKYGNLL